MEKEKYLNLKAKESVVGFEFEYSVDKLSKIKFELGSIKKTSLFELIFDFEEDDVNGVIGEVLNILERKEVLRKRGTYIPVISNAVVDEGSVAAMVLCGEYEKGVYIDRAFYAGQEDIKTLMALIVDIVETLKFSEYKDKMLKIIISKFAADNLLKTLRVMPESFLEIESDLPDEELPTVVTEADSLRIKHLILQDVLDEMGKESIFIYNDLGQMYVKSSGNMFFTYSKDGNKGFILSIWKDKLFGELYERIYEEENDYNPSKLLAILERI